MQWKAEEEIAATPVRFLRGAIGIVVKQSTDLVLVAFYDDEKGDESCAAFAYEDIVEFGFNRNKITPDDNLEREVVTFNAER